MDWINRGAPEDEEPESRFSEYLSALGKSEKMQAKADKGDASEDDLLVLSKLKAKLESIKACISDEYTSADVDEAALA